MVFIEDTKYMAGKFLEKPGKCKYSCIASLLCVPLEQKMKEIIEEILESEFLLEELMLKIIQEINDDDEPLDKKCRQLLLA